jgi:hypothetical protein
MAFTDDVVRVAWCRAGAMCECGRAACTTHWRRHMKVLAWNMRGRDVERGWEAHARTAAAGGSGNTPSNCEILCFDCHKKTLTHIG